MLLFVLSGAVFGFLMVRLARPRSQRLAGPSTFPTAVRGVVRVVCWAALAVLVFFAALMVATGNEFGGLGARVAASVFGLALIGAVPVWLLRNLPVASRRCRRCGHIATARRCPHCDPADARGGVLRRAWVLVATQPKRD